MIKKYWIHIVVVIVIIFLILLFVDFQAWNNILKKSNKETDSSNEVNDLVNNVVTGNSNNIKPTEPLFVYPRAGVEVTVWDKETRKILYKTKNMIGKFIRKTDDGKYYEVLWDEDRGPGLVYGGVVYVTKKK